MFTARPFTEAELAEARRRYEAGDSLASIAAGLGISQTTLRRRRLRWGWPERPAAGGVEADQRPVRKAAKPVAAAEDAAVGVDTRGLSRRVEAAVRRELSGLEKRLTGSADPAEAERNARVLASLVKSLVELGRLEAVRKQTGGGGHESSGVDATEDDRRPPRDLAELREALAARLERIRAERESG